MLYIPDINGILDLPHIHQQLNTCSVFSMLYSSLFLLALQSGISVRGAKATPSTSTSHEKRALDTSAIATKYFGNDAPWYKDRIAYFECSDSQITDVYYYRQKIFRAHQRDLGAKGYISTEFLDDVRKRGYKYHTPKPTRWRLDLSVQVRISLSHCRVVSLVTESPKRFEA
jgi:hypothetical protein